MEGIDRPRGVKNTDVPRQRRDESGEEGSKACPKGRTSRTSLVVSVGAGEESTVGGAVTSVSKPGRPPNSVRRSKTVAVGNGSPDVEHLDRQIHAAGDLIESSPASYTRKFSVPFPGIPARDLLKNRGGSASRREVGSEETIGEHEVHREPASLSRGVD